MPYYGNRLNDRDLELVRAKDPTFTTAVDLLNQQFNGDLEIIWVYSCFSDPGPDYCLVVAVTGRRPYAAEGVWIGNAPPLDRWDDYPSLHILHRIGGY